MANYEIVPSVDYAEQAIQRADLAPSTKAQYAKALRNYLATGASLADAGELQAYAAKLPRSSKAFLKAAVRLAVRDLAIQAKAGATPANVDTITAGLYRIEAIQEAIKIKTVPGVKAHLWLSRSQVQAMMAACGDDLIGQRDWVVLALLVGAGLRRAELAELRFADIKRQPYGSNGRIRTVLEVRGKGAKDRVVPISDKLAERLQAWRAVVGDGLICRSLGRKIEIGVSLSTIGIFKIVRAYGARIGVPELAPHDLRRTYAQLGYQAGVAITQISRLLGHASVKTTQKYLNLDLDLDTTVSDFIPL